MSNNDEKNYKTVLSKKLKSPQSIDESLLSLDNTLLCNVETDNKLHSSSKTYNASQKHSNSMMQIFKEQGIKTATTVSKISQNTSFDPNEWQDKSLMNQIFAQFDLQEQKEIIPDNILKNKEDKQNIENSHISFPEIEDNHEISPILKLKSRTLEEYKISRKKLCLYDPEFRLEKIKNEESKSIEYSSFYGLSNTVKKLIQEVKGIYELYQWQEECLKLAIRTKKNLIYTLPTSGGKTLVAEILMFREIIRNKRNVIFILPYVALVQEKVQSMAILALKLDFLVEEYAGTKGCYPPIKRRRKNSIYICTTEKALGLINSLIETKRLAEIGLMVIDELHLLGESGGRGATLEGLLTKIMFLKETIRLIGMSATIGNIKEIAQFLYADTYSQNFRPIKIREYVKCENDIWIIDLKSKKLLSDMTSKDYQKLV